jgi:metal-dependent amidase/aminoacylase/carboxypeptidase family protein
VGVDAAMMMHPSSINLVNMPCVCMAELDVVYRGQAAHAARCPSAAINALDALVLAYQGVAALRQHIRATERIHGIFTDGGQAPNVVPERAAGPLLRARRLAAELEALKPRVEGCFRAGAAATAPSSSSRGARPTISTSASTSRSRARSAPTPSSSAASSSRTTSCPRACRAAPTWATSRSACPSIHPMLAAAPPHCTIHNAEFAKWAGSRWATPAAIDGAKALAMTALDFLADAGPARAHARVVRSRVSGSAAADPSERVDRAVGSALGRVSIAADVSVWHNA